jgi:cellulose synthase/poly-beta-1,6-N-acetylglucosamine synthase-like glycosyltransferase
MIIVHIILWFFFIYLALNVLYLLLFATAGLFRKPPAYNDLPEKKKIAVLIPAYKEDGVIVETAKAAASHSYPADYFDVFIIADQLKNDTLEALAALPVRVIQVSFAQSTKAKSIKYTLQQIPDQDYDILMILDADNIMGKGCLEKINSAFQKGLHMVQLHRTAKNKNTSTAILDAASEEINNHIFRQGHRALGISSALIGSGMAFDFAQFKRLMLETDIENNPGEDREIYLEMLRQGYVCEYIDDALVYDEKVQSGQVLEKQRTRWLSAQLQYAVRFWIKEPLKTFTYNIHYFDYAVQTLLIPRVMLLGISFMMAVISIVLHVIFHIALFPGMIIWIISFAGMILSLFGGLYKRMSYKEIVHAMYQLPATFLSFLKAMSRSKVNQKEFIHTPKEYLD